MAEYKLAGGEALALPDAVKDTQLRPGDQQVVRHAVAVGGDDAGHDQQQGPEDDEHAHHEVQDHDLPPVAEAVQQVGGDDLLAPDQVDQEDQVTQGKDPRDHIHHR